MFLSHTKSFNGQEITLTVEYKREEVDSVVSCEIVGENGVVCEISSFLEGIWLKDEKCSLLNHLCDSIDWGLEYREATMEYCSMVQGDE